MDVRPGYKQTDLAVIPAAWDIKTLAETTDCFDNLRIPLNEAQRAEMKGDYPYCGANGIVDYVNDFVVDDDIILIAEDGGYFDEYASRPIAYRMNGKCWVNNHAHILKARHGFDQDFVFHSLVHKNILGFLASGTRAKLNKAEMWKIQIATPPSLIEQRHIAEALDAANDLLGGLDRLIAKKRAIKQGAMQVLLSGQKRLPCFSEEWKLTRLGDLGATFGGLTGKTKSDFGRGTASYITFMNIMTNVVIDVSAFESVAVSPSEAQNQVTKGDLFFNGSSESPEEVGMCSVLTEHVTNVFLNSFCFGFRRHTHVDVDGLFLAYYFRSDEGRELLKSLAQGATRYNLSKTALLKVTFPLPPSSEQVAIAAVLSDMDAEITALKQRRAKIASIKHGMMQSLLTGRIRLPVTEELAA